MQTNAEYTTTTEVKLTVILNEGPLATVKEMVLRKLGKDLKLAGFRPGKAPIELVEKNVNQQLFQSEFLEEAINTFYIDAVNKQDLRPVEQPKVTIKKFVPFTTLEFEAIVPVIGKIVLTDYKKIKKVAPVIKEVTEEDVNQVLSNISTRLAEKVDVDRKAQDGDQVWIDFDGFSDDGNPIPGGDGKDYPLVIGSNTFIPGFEPNLIGTGAGDEKEFRVKFPKDYHAKELQSKNVTFKVSVKKVQEVVRPKQDDELAKKVGPFNTLTELKSDVKEQLKRDKQIQADRQFESELMEEITEKSKIDLPEALIQKEVDYELNKLRQELVYKGQTFPEYLISKGKSEDEFVNTEVRPDATKRLKASILLSEIAEKEGLKVTPEELNSQIFTLKAQYDDENSKQELDKPETQREIATRILADKTIDRLVEYTKAKALNSKKS